MKETEKIEIMHFDQEGYLEDGRNVYEAGKRMTALADRVHEEGYDAVFLMGVGGTWDEFMQLEYLMNKFGDRDLEVYLIHAAEWNVMGHKRMTEKSVVLTASESGTTPEVLEAVKKMKEKGIRVYAMTKPEGLIGQAVGAENCVKMASDHGNGGCEMGYYLADCFGLRLLNRYDVEGIDEVLFHQCVSTVFSEPPVDNTYAELPASDGVSFAVEYLPGQFDQRADSAAECIQLISQGERPLVRSARVYLLEGTLTDEQVAEIKKYVINPVEAREASLDTKQTLKMEYPVPAPVKVLEGFNQLDEEQLKKFIADNGLAMDLGDIEFCQKYFRSEHRDPTITEIKMIDTYWSDHCRHTTFSTELTNVTFGEGDIPF